MPMDWKLIPLRLGAQHAAFSISPLGWPGWELGDLLHKPNEHQSRKHRSNGRFQRPHVDCLNVVSGHSAKSKFSEPAS